MSPVGARCISNRIAMRAAGDRGLSTEGTPRWATSGAELSYLTDNGEVVAVPVRTTGSLELGQPARLFQLPGLIDFDIHPNGERVAVLQRDEASSATSRINIVVNWFEELKAKMREAEE